MPLNRRHLVKAAAAAAALAAGPRGAFATARPARPPQQALPLDAVRLLDSPYGTALQANREYLLTLEPDRLLHNYRLNAGLAAKGAIYGGWESDTIAGHTLGHYLSALSLLYAQTGEEQAPPRVAYIVGELAECQAASPEGFVGGFLRRRGTVLENGRLAMEEVRRGDIRSRPFDLNGAWSPLYNWHKLMAGLLDAQRHCGNDRAIIVATALGGYIESMFAGLTAPQIQQVLICEYGGLNESFAELHARTGEPRWLRLARLLFDTKVLGPLTEGRDDLANLHANTQVPKLIGLHRLYELTAEREFATAAETFWTLVTSRYSYVIGGNADREYFQAPRSISRHITEQTCESCNTYNMLKLTRRLYAANPRAELFDFYERAHFNHILAQHHPRSGMFAYMVPLMSGSHREYSSPFDDFWCCVGTGMESHSKHGDSIYWSSGTALFVNLYIASRVQWREQDMILELDTRYPFDERIDLKVLECGASAPATIALRIPAWCSRAHASINGISVRTPSRDGYLEMRRVWHPDDHIVLTLPRTLRIEATADDSRTVAFLYGAMVLAADLGPADSPWSGAAPVLVGRDLLAGVQPIPDTPDAFATRGLGSPTDLTLRPFTVQYDRNTAVYFQCFDQVEWRTEQARRRADEERMRELLARSIDSVHLGDMQAERDHQLDAQFSNPVVYRGRKGRDARAGGYFQFSMASRVGPLLLRTTYWGEERDRRFLIRVEDVEIARVSLDGLRGGDFFDSEYPIPQDLTEGKTRILVRFEPEPGVSAGPVFGVRLLPV